MRPLTEAFLQKNMAYLTKKGWKPNEQLQIFKKVDKLLDYVSEYLKLSKVKKEGLSKSGLKSDLLKGLGNYLSENIPDEKKQKFALNILKSMLSFGETLMIKAAWLYRNHPIIFKRNYASSLQAYHKDSSFFMMKGHTVPTNSFTPFKTGENPVLSNDKIFSQKCVQMNSDYLFETPDFLKYDKLAKTDKNYYIHWLTSTKSGRHFNEVNSVLLFDIIPNLSLKKNKQSKANKTSSCQILRQKKQNIK